MNLQTIVYEQKSYFNFFYEHDFIKQYEHFFVHCFQVRTIF